MNNKIYNIMNLTLKANYTLKAPSILIRLREYTKMYTGLEAKTKHLYI